MKARDMFEELGWEYREDDDLITYEDIADSYYIVDFYLDTKTYNTFDNYGEETEIKNKKVLEAINKQIEELGW